MTDRGLCTTTYDSSESHAILVPNRHVAAVYRLLADLMDSEGRAEVYSLRAADEPDASAMDLAVVEGQGTWSPDMVTLLQDNLTSTTVRTAIDLLASRPGQVVPFDDLLGATGLRSEQLRAELAALSKLTSRLFGRKTWPMVARQGMAGGSTMAYRMPATIAEWWTHGAIQKEAG